MTLSAQSPVVACQDRLVLFVHGISKALTYYEPALRGVLKKGGFLTRELARCRAKKVWTRQGPQKLPVLQTLSRRQSLFKIKGRRLVALFLSEIKFRQTFITVT